MNEEKRFEEVERGIQEMLLSWVERRNWAERILVKRASRFFLGREMFKDMLEMYRIASEGVEQCLESVETLKELRRLRFRTFVLKRIQRRRRKIHEISNS